MVQHDESASPSDTAVIESPPPPVVTDVPPIQQRAKPPRIKRSILTDGAPIEDAGDGGEEYTERPVTNSDPIVDRMHAQQAIEARDGILMSIDIASIDLDVSNHRLENDEDAITDLAYSIDKDGLQSPIAVYRKLDDPKRFTLGYGFRRLQAHRILFRTQIRAFVKPPADEMAIRAAQAIENLFTKNLKPMEEAVACEQILTSVEAELPDDPHEARVENAAAKIGRDPKWFQGRLNLMRLSAKCRQMMIDGKLLLGHALQIAKLVTAGEQDEVAERVHFDEDLSRCYTSVSEIRRAVADRMLTLRGTPWKLDVSFANGPACDGCTHNTDNAHPSLFAEDGKEEKPEARCLNAKCYNAKKRACDKALPKAVKALVELKITPTATAAKEVSGAYLKPATVARHADKQINPNKASASKPKSGSSSSYNNNAYEIKWKAERQARDHNRKLNREESEKIFETLDLADRPFAIAAMFLVQALECWEQLNAYGGLKEKDHQAYTAELRRWVVRINEASGPEIVSDLVKKLQSEAGKGETVEDLVFRNRDGLDDCVPAFAAALGIPTQPRKTTEDFMPAPKPPKPAPAAKPAKPKAPQPVTHPSSTFAAKKKKSKKHASKKRSKRGSKAKRKAKG